MQFDKFIKQIEGRLPDVLGSNEGAHIVDDYYISSKVYYDKKSSSRNKKLESVEEANLEYFPDVLHKLLKYLVNFVVRTDNDFKDFSGLIPSINDYVFSACMPKNVEDNDPLQKIENYYTDMSLDFLKAYCLSERELIPLERKMFEADIDKSIVTTNYIDTNDIISVMWNSILNEEIVPNYDIESDVSNIELMALLINDIITGQLEIVFTFSSDMSHAFSKLKLPKRHAIELIGNWGEKYEEGDVL